MTITGLTVADLEAMPDDGRRYELIGGAIVMTPAPGVEHQRVSHRLYSLLQDAWPAMEIVYAPIDLDLPGGQRVQPDLVAVERGRTGPRLSLPVGLVVEIVSPGSQTNDRVTKRATYAAAGIPTYWIVNLIDKRIEVRTQPGLVSGQPGYAHQQDFAPGDLVPLILDGGTVATIDARELLP